MFREEGIRPDRILATDMLDLSTFLALTRDLTAGVPALLYFHENQITYPWSPDDRDREKGRDTHYGFINIASALAADACWFNSRFHLESFVRAVEPFLRQFPDFNEPDTASRIREKSRVLHLGLDLERLDHFRAEKEKTGGPPLVLWNHRWEYDKNPADFFQVLFELADEEVEFRVAVLGEHFVKHPPVFREARERLGDRIVHFGYASDFREYASWLWKADILPVTSNQEFFGASLMEALYCETIPILPRRLTYPELVDYDRFNDFFYDDREGLKKILRKRLLSFPETDRRPLREIAARYHWQNMAPIYDRAMEEQG
jgi:glycosyltransferase involved in cell wall biosynthesis